MNTNILKALLFCPAPEGFWGLPGLLWGAPGEGKTALMRAIARQFGLPYFRLSPAEQGEGRFGVVPVPGADGYLHYPAPADVVNRFTDRGLLFLDEINLAPPALQAPLLGCVQLRVIGNYQFPIGVRVIGAANEVRDAAGGWDLAPALCNRFGHFDYQGLEASEWGSALLGGFVSGESKPITASDLEAHVMEKWPEAIALARGMVAGFITRRPDLLRKRPAKGSSERAWPSPRSCEYACTAIASAAIHGLDESDTDELVSAFVGLGWVSEYRAWANMADLPVPADVLDEKVKFVHDPRRHDRTLAVLGACAALVIPEKAVRRQERAAVCWQLIGSVIADAADVAIPAAKALIVARLKISSKTDARTMTLSALHPIMVSAGLVSA